MTTLPGIRTAGHFQKLLLGSFLLVLFLVVSLLYENSLYFSICLSALCCLLPLVVVRFQATSLVAIVALTHLVSYPIPAFLALFLDYRYQAIEDYLWHSTPSAMFACALGMLGLSIGSRLASRPFAVPLSSSPTKPFANFLILALLIPTVVVSYLNGFYYHSTVTGLDAYDSTSANTYGFLGYISWVSVAGILLQLKRYFSTRSSKDLLLVGLFLAMYFVLLAPSGSRIRLFTGLVVVLAGFWEWEARRLVKVGVFLGCLFVFSFLIPFLESYRSNAVAYESQSGFLARLSLISDVRTVDIGNYSNSPEAKLGSLVRRMADYVSVGQIISVVPETFPYRGAQTMGEWWVFLVPTLLRPSTTLSFTEGADWALAYGIRPDNNGSSPIMLLGDLYSRFSWWGVLLGMVAIGFIIRKIEVAFFPIPTFGLIFYVTMAQQIVSIYTYSLLICFAFFTRQLLIILLLSVIFTKFLRKYGKAN